MLPLPQKILFLLFAVTMGAISFHGFRRLYRRIAAGREDTESRMNQPLRRIGYSLSTTLTQRRTFKKRPWVSFFHSLIFYGFVLYLLVNLIDAVEGFVELAAPVARARRESLRPGCRPSRSGCSSRRGCACSATLPAAQPERLRLQRTHSASQRRASTVHHSRLDYCLGIYSVSCWQPSHRRRGEAGSQRPGSLCTLRYAALPSVCTATCACVAHLWILGSAGKRACFPRLLPLLQTHSYLPCTRQVLSCPRFLIWRFAAAGCGPGRRRAEAWREQARGSSVAATARRLCLHPMQPLPGCLPRYNDRQVAQPIRS